LARLSVKISGLRCSTPSFLCRLQCIIWEVRSCPTRFGPQASVFRSRPLHQTIIKASTPNCDRHVGAQDYRFGCWVQGAGSTKARGDEDENQNDAYRMNRRAAKSRDDPRCSFVPWSISPLRTLVRRSTRRRRPVPRPSGTGAGKRRPRTDMPTSSP
jgi:hypothetical protein